MDRSLRISRRRLMSSAIAVAATGLAVRRASAASSSEVSLAAGRLRGIQSADVHVFKGVPYAARSPGGRFLPARPAEPWQGVRAALQWPARCPQHNPPAAGEIGDMFRVMGDQPAAQSEDCLALNIWTRGLNDNSRRPVLVWLHGGGFTVGSGSSSLYDGTRLCRRGDVVVVTLNHRLNLFGHLSLAGLGFDPEYADSANVGMLDVVEALRWVQRNIGAFGGDPDNVTIFGQSGGGAKVSTLLAMPVAKGLFHKAIIQSGPGVRAIEPQQALEITAEVLRRLDLAPRDARRLLALPVEDLVRILGIRGNDAMGQLRLGPVVDGRSLTAHPFDPAAPAVSADVPLLIGTTTDEMTAIFGPSDPTIFDLREADLQQRTAALVGPIAAEVIAAYRAQRPAATPSALYSLIVSDHLMRRGTIEIAERRALLSRAPTYVYWFGRGSPRFGGKYGATHSIDLPYVFDNVDVAQSLVGDGPDPHVLAATVSSAWIAFARQGSPQAPDLPAWRPYTPADRATMLLADRCALLIDPVPAVRTTLSRAPRWVF